MFCWFDYADLIENCVVFVTSEVHFKSFTEKVYGLNSWYAFFCFCACVCV